MQHGFIQLTDRIADLIKRGGEWIASQELENALMGHPAVREAAVIGVAASEVERAARSRRSCSRTASRRPPTSCKAFIAAKFPKFWMPDAFVFVEAIPRTSAGKFKKTELARSFRDWQWK